MVIVGDGEGGKTSLVTRMSTGTFVDNGYLPTVFETETLEVHAGGKQVELVMYNTAVTGQEVYDRLRPLSYHDVGVAIICFSLAEPDTLANVRENWTPEIRYCCGNVPIILVGNKKDLRDTPTPEVTSTSTSNSASTSSLPSTTGTKERLNRQRTRERSPKNHMSGSPCDDVIATKDFATYATTISISSRPRLHVHATVKHSEGAMTAERIGATAYFETSALTGEHVEELLLANTKAAVLGTKKSKKFKPFADTLRSWKSIDSLERR